MLQVHGRWRRVRSNSQPAEYVASEQSWLGMKAMRCNNYMSKPFANDCANWGGLKIAICGLICVGEVLVPIGCVVMQQNWLAYPRTCF